MNTQNPHELPELHFLPCDRQEVGTMDPGVLAVLEKGLQGLKLDSDAMRVVPEDLARRYQALPLELRENRLLLGLVDPDDEIALDDFRLITGYDVEAVRVDAETLQAALQGYPYPGERLVCESLLPLQQHQVAASITGPIASVQVRQRFTNQLSETSETIYLYPLPQDAVLTDFQMIVGNRTVQGEVQQGLPAHKPTVLRNIEAANQLQVRLGNLVPGEQVIVEFRYALKLELSRNQTTLRVPLSRNQAADDVSLEVEFENGPTRPTQLACSHPQANLILNDQGKLQLSARGSLQQDFVLQLRHQTEEPQAFLVTNEDHFLLTLFPSPQNKPTPRDTIFLLDRSGSMNSTRLASASEAILGFIEESQDTDRFALMSFGSGLESFRGGKFSQDSVAARQWLTGLQAEGSTSLDRAFAALDSYATEPGRLLCCVLVTDGQIEDREKPLRLAESLSKRMRIFTVGIDAVMPAVLRQLARNGRGTCKLTTHGPELEQALHELQTQTRTLQLTGLQVEDTGLNTLCGSMTLHNPDLFASAPIVIMGRHLGLGNGCLALRGIQLDGSDWSCELKAQSVIGDALSAVWAGQKLEFMEDQLELADYLDRQRIETELAALATEYRLLTPYTRMMLRGSWQVQGETAELSISRPDPEPPIWVCEDPRASARQLVEEPPIVRVIELILSEAIKAAATHIHIEPECQSSRVRFRVDSLLHDVMTPPKDIHQALVERLRYIAEDGRITVNCDGVITTYMLNISDTRFGDKALLELKSKPVEWSNLGEVGPHLKSNLQAPGLVLVVGLARSGLNSTLAGCAEQLAKMGKHVVLWNEKSECPDGVSPLPIAGELDDEERLSLLVSQDLDALVTRPLSIPLQRQLSATAHSYGQAVGGMFAPDAISALRQWAALGCACSVLRMIVAQARVRRLCGCGIGCEQCRETGYRGELTFYEALPVNPQVWAAFRSGLSLRPFLYSSLHRQAAKAVASGLTNEDELRRVGLDSALGPT